MTNVMRTAGVRPALLSLALDMGKAVLAVVLARAHFSIHEALKPPPQLPRLWDTTGPFSSASEGGEALLRAGVR